MPRFHGLLLIAALVSATVLSSGASRGEETGGVASRGKSAPVDGSTGHILVEGAPLNAVFYLDGRALSGPLPRRLDVTPGDHVLAACTQDGAWIARLNARAGQETPTTFAIAFVHRTETWPPPRPR